MTVTILSLYHRAQNAARNQFPQGRSRTASIVVKLPGPFPTGALGTANIRFDLNGAPGLKYDMMFANDAHTQQMSGVLPAQVSFQADAFTASLKVYGPGEFGFEAYRDTRPLAIGSLATFTNAFCNYFIRSTAGGQSVSINASGRPGFPVPPR